MEGITLQQICNIIILISAVIIAFKNIYHFFKKPVDTVSEKAIEKERKRIEEVMENKMPELAEQYVQKFSGEIQNLTGRLEEIKEINLNQQKDLKGIQSSIDLINNAQMDTMRYIMNSIYYRYRPYKKILSSDKKAFMKFYSDYHSMGGNTWIDTLYGELKEWEVAEDSSELR